MTEKEMTDLTDWFAEREWQNLWLKILRIFLEGYERLPRTLQILLTPFIFAVGWALVWLGS